MAPDRVSPDPAVLLSEATRQTRRGELQAGWQQAQAAFESYRTRGDRDGRMRTINLLGAIAWERGMMAEAELHFS
jgi:hypothetical protein